MDEIKAIIEKIEKVKDGFKPIQEEAEKALATKPAAESLTLAQNKQHAEVAINLLSDLKDDEHEYVRKSVGNALRDISRFREDLVKAELQTWDTSDPKIAYTYRLASKFLQG